MGLLDDAIREHLELKRRIGADPGEVARLERAAFGDAEGAEAATEPAQPGDESPHQPEPHDEPATAAAEAAATPDADAEPTGDLPSEHDRGAAGSQPEEEDEQATRQFTAVEAEDAQRRHPRPPGESPPAEEEVHDELEETPDFLQETPDHDRLWFEQKPPRDFDF